MQLHNHSFLIVSFHFCLIPYYSYFEKKSLRDSIPRLCSLYEYASKRFPAISFLTTDFSKENLVFLGIHYLLMYNEAIIDKQIKYCNQKV